MIRPLLAVMLALAPPLGAQLPYLTAPRGTLRLELAGRFDPTSSEFADGTKRGFGDPIGAAALTAATSPLLRDLDARLGTVLGRPPAGGSLGGLTADAMLQRGSGVIGLAVGVTNRITAFTRIPIVSVRTEARLVSDPDGATLGINPALSGSQASAQFLAQFAGALAELQTRLDAGEYAGSPATEALATQTLSEGGVLRDALQSLLVSPESASPVLPVATSADGQALLTTVATLRDRFDASFGIAGFNAAPELPSGPISDAGLEQLLGSPTGFDLASFDQQPLVGLGDVEVGVVASLVNSRSIERRSWFGFWATGSLTLPSGAPPDPRYLRDGGTGDGQLDVVVGGIIEAGRGRLGVRGGADYRLQLTGSREARVGRRDEFLLPAYRTASLDWDPGDVLTLSATPYLRLTDRMAITGQVTWWSRSADRWSAAEDTVPGGTGDVAAMGDGTAASALRLGIGLGYAHDGASRDGERRMPVEAGLGIERTVASGSGLVAAPLTTKVWFRVYKRLW